MNDILLILDRQEKVVGVLKNTVNTAAAPFFDDVFHQNVTTGAETFSFSALASSPQARDLVIGNYIAFRHGKDFKLFQIIETSEYHNESLYIDIYCECAGLDLITNAFRKRKLVSCSLKKFLTEALENTGWKVGALDYLASQLAVDLDLENDSVYSILQNNISKFNCELSFRVVIKQGKIVQKFIDTYNNRGKITGKRFEFGRNIEGIKRVTSGTSLFTALIGIGKNGLNFSNVTVEGIDKPLGQDFVADQKAFDKYNHKGNHLMGFFEYDTESPEELLRQTYKKLQDLKQPQITYDVEIALVKGSEDLEIGDTIAIIDNSFNPAIHLMARVVDLYTSKTNPDSNKCVISNFIEVKSNITAEMRKIAQELENAVDNKVNSKFPIGSEDIQNGAVTGDHIYENSITTDHLVAEAITAEKIHADAITANHIKGTVVEAINLNATNAVIDSAKIGDLDASKITSGSISAGAIQGNVIEAINMSVSGKISANKIDVGSLTVEEIDAGKITSGYLNSARIEAGSITADKVTIGDMTNICKLNPELEAYRGGNEVELLSATNKLCFKKSGSNYTGIRFAKTYVLDFAVGDEYVFEHFLYCTADISMINFIRYYYTDGTYSNAGSTIYKPTIDTIEQRRTIVKITKAPESEKTVREISFSLEKNNVPAAFYIRDMKLYKKGSGKLIVNGSITAENIATGAITADKITSGAVITEKLDAKSVTAEKIATGAIKAEHISAGSINSDKIQSGAITTEKLDANAITAEIIKGQVIEAINLSTTNAKIQSAKIEDLNADKIVAGDIDAERIQSQVIAAINSYAGTARIKQAQIETLKVGNANITELDAAKIKTGKLSAERIDTENLSVKGSLISGTIIADKISGGTLDASKMTVKNLKADNITAGSITVQGDNLLHNSAMKKPLILFQDGVNDSDSLNNWINTYSQNAILPGTVDNYKGYNYLKLSGTSATTSGIVLSRLPFIPGEQYVFSFYYFINNDETISNTFGIILDGFTTEENAIKGVISKSVAIKTWADNSVTKGSWTKIVINMQLPSDTEWSSFKYFALRPRFLKNDTGIIRIAMPMLSKGTIASVFKEHTDELIGKDAVDSEKLDTDEIFSEDSAFIKRLRTVELDAEQITVNKIKGSQIDIQGFIKFEHMSQEVADNFIAPTDGSGTWINGGKIFTGSIKADSIDIRGLTVRDKTEEPTFVIDKDGEVAIKGNVQSTNWNEQKKRGYRITKDGEATFNKATINGEILLPNAGITNFGGIAENQNLLKESYPNITTNSYLIKSFYFGDKKPIEGKTYTISIKGKLGEGKTGFGIYNSGGSIGIVTLTPSMQGTNGIYKTTCIWKVTSGSGTVSNTYLNVYALQSSITSESTIEWIKLEEGNEASDEWFPAPEDNLNPVRFWAGTSYKNRDKAPFRVLQDGSVFASKGTFDGTFTGKLNIGNIYIEDTNSTNGAILVKTNDDIEDKIKLSVDESFIDTPFILGSVSDKRLEFSKENNMITLNNTVLRHIGQMTTTSFEYGDGAFGGMNVKGKNGGHHVLRHSADRTYCFDSEGERGDRGDFTFIRKNGGEKVQVRVQGSLNVDDKITSINHGIEMRNTSTGFAFYAT